MSLPRSGTHAETTLNAGGGMCESILGPPTIDHPDQSHCSISSGSVKDVVGQASTLAQPDGPDNRYRTGTFSRLMARARADIAAGRTRCALAAARGPTGVR